MSLAAVEIELDQEDLARLDEVAPHDVAAGQHTRT